MKEISFHIQKLVHYRKAGKQYPICGSVIGVFTESAEEVDCAICKMMLENVKFIKPGEYEEVKVRVFPETLECSCEEWKYGMRQLNGAIANHCNHHGRYDAEWFAFCPWCGKKLEIKAINKEQDGR